MAEKDNLIIRTFESGDQNSSRELILAGLEGHFGCLNKDLNRDLDDIESAYTTAGNMFFVAESGGRILGTVALIAESKERARIARLSVLLNYRRKGIAESLIHHLLANAKDVGFRSVVVETNNDWLPARKLYEKLGFSVTGLDEESVHFKLNF